MSKYGAVPVEIDNIRFASKAEARRYMELKLLLRADEISDLELHPSWKLIVNDVLIGRYSADFSYKERSGKFVVEDVKGGAVSRDYPLRKRLMLACHGIAIKEVA